MPCAARQEKVAGGRAAMTHTDHSELGALLRSPGDFRLWMIGLAGNSMRWLEVLAAALFTLDVTGSGLAVAVVSAARTMPMLLFGALAGVVSEAVDRERRLLLVALAVSALSAAAGSARPSPRAGSRSPGTWHSPASSAAPSGRPRCPLAAAWSARSPARASPARWRSTPSPDRRPAWSARCWAAWAPNWSGCRAPTPSPPALYLLRHDPGARPAARPGAGAAAAGPRARRSRRRLRLRAPTRWCCACSASPIAMNCAASPTPPSWPRSGGM